MGSSASDRNDESSNCTLGSGSSAQSVQEKSEEQRKIRRLQMMMDMVMSVISQDGSLTVDQAAELVADSRKPRSPCSLTKSSPTTSFTGLASKGS